MEFYNTAIRLRKSFIYLLMRDLGVKAKPRDYKFLTKGMDEKDAAALLAIVEKYHYRKVPSNVPSWVLVKLRNSIWDYLRDLMTNITRAYTIWATCRAEANERRVAQDRAISACESLLKELELALSILPVDANKYATQAEMIEKEIALLKGWRKSDNKRFKGLK